MGGGLGVSPALLPQVKDSAALSDNLVKQASSGLAVPNCVGTARWVFHGFGRLASGSLTCLGTETQLRSFMSLAARPIGVSTPSAEARAQSRKVCALKRLFGRRSELLGGNGANYTEPLKLWMGHIPGFLRFCLGASQKI